MNEFIMADENIEIKIEPLDDEESTAIKVEELIIKTDFDNSLPESEQQNELLIVKQEPPEDEDEHYLIQVDSEIWEPGPVSDAPKFECDTCKRDFTSARGLSVHKRLRCRNVNICNICGQVFRTRIILQDHVQQHKHKLSKTARTSPTVPRSLPKTSPKSSPEPTEYSCKICQLTFSGSQDLTSHNRIHEGFKHICNKCGKSFKHAAELKRHNSGDTCATEAIEDVLKYSQSDIKIKEEVEWESESSTVGILDGVQSNETVGEHRLPLPPSVQSSQDTSAIVIKKELVEELVQVKEEPQDSFDYEELILQELIDRKAKSIAKAKATQVQTQTNRSQVGNDSKSVPVEKTDFEQVIHSNTLIVSPQRPKLEKRSSTEDDSNPHSIALEQDFEEIIKPNTLHDKSQIIENLKEEYQKAKKKKLEEALTDDSSQTSTKQHKEETALCSLYFSVTVDPEPYNRAVRRLKKTNSEYRYSWVCPFCPRRYIQRHGFVKHLMSTHLKSKADLEGKIFELKPEILSLNTNNDDSFCHLCRVTLADFATLKKHRSEFHKEDTSIQLPFKCDKCGKFCSTRSTLGDHVQANCGTEPQYGCTECGKKFYTKSTLNLHKTMHTGELPHKCTFCEKQFRTRGQLTVHTRTHTGERPFPCKVCEKRFTHRETLIAHLSRHIDMKRYKCYGCQSFFSCISGLKTHRLTRMSTCGQFKLNARPVGPRVRVIKGNVIFEPQPKINPYSRRENDDPDEVEKRKVLLQKNGQNVQEIENLFKKEPISVDS